MSFIQDDKTSKPYLPGYFLDREECVRKTRTIPQSLATTAANGTKYVKAGTPFPSNDGSCVGLLYEDVDVTTGAMPGSVVLAGSVIEGRLPVELAGAAKSALSALGFTFVTEASVTRPDDDTN